MKTILNKILVLLLVCFVMASCGTEDMKFKNANVTPVEKLYEPDNGKTITLSSAAGASLYFSWEPAKTEDSGAALYEIVFDKVGGDFSSPLYTITADRNGFSTGASITHIQLNTIGKLNGAEQGEQTKVIWSVRSSRGMNMAVAKEARELTFTRLVGLEAPQALYITGSATEGGADLAGALPFKKIGDDEFEIYTQLTAGQTYKLASSKNASDPELLYYYIDGTLKESGSDTDETTVTQTTGIYRIRLNFLTTTVTFTEIQSVDFFFCPTNTKEWALSYAGKGVWQGTGLVTFKQESWGGDERYKFRVGTSDGEEDWGPVNKNEDGKPSGAPEYFNLAVYTPVTQWDHKWKFANEFNGKNVTLTVYMQGNSDYRHTVE